MAAPRRRGRDIVIVLVLCALPLGMLRARARQGNPDDLNILDRVFLRLLGPLERGVLGVGGFFAGIGRRYIYLVHTEATNQTLTVDNAKLRADNVRLQHEAERVPLLEGLLGMRARILAPTVPAKLVGLETSSYFRVVRLVLQADVEVKPGMPVIGAEGVVGRVERVAGPYCDVMLLTDLRSAIDVTLPHSKTRGLLHGSPDGRRYSLTLQIISRDPRDTDIAEGDVLVTSTLSAFPPNLPVGRVTKVLKKEFAEQEIDVEPLVDLARIDEMMIVLVPPAPVGGKKL